jgi:hypothetical protein
MNPNLCVCSSKTILSDIDNGSICIIELSLNLLFPSISKSEKLSIDGIGHNKPILKLIFIDKVVSNIFSLIITKLIRLHLISIIIFNNSNGLMIYLLSKRQNICE